MRRSLFLTALAVTLVALHGLVHGWWSGRWSDSDDPHGAARRLAALPMTINEWDGEPMAIDAKHQAIGEICGYVSRRYIHRRHKTVLSLLIVWGRGGPIAVHTPDVCYRGAGFELEGTPERRSFAFRTRAVPAEFWAASFRKRGEQVAQLCIFWGWNDNQGWKAPTHPRLAFGGTSLLYKLYVVRETSTAAEGNMEADPGAEFLRLLLPVLDTVMSEE